MILIVSFPNNEHVEQVPQASYGRVGGCRHGLVFLRCLLRGLSAAIGREQRMLATEPAWRPKLLPLCRVGAVWYRRIRPYGFHEDLRDETSRLFAWSEANEALLGVWYSLDCFWMNPPVADEVSQRKIRQLQLGAAR